MIHRGMFAGFLRKLVAVVAVGGVVYALWRDTWLVYLAAVALYIASFAVSQYTFASLAAQHAKGEE